MEQNLNLVKAFFHSQEPLAKTHYCVTVLVFAQEASREARNGKQDMKMGISYYAHFKISYEILWGRRESAGCSLFSFFLFRNLSLTSKVPQS